MSQQIYLQPAICFSLHHMLLILPQNVCMFLIIYHVSRDIPITLPSNLCSLQTGAVAGSSQIISFHQLSVILTFYHFPLQMISNHKFPECRLVFPLSIIPASTHPWKITGIMENNVHVSDFSMKVEAAWRFVSKLQRK